MPRKKSFFERLTGAVNADEDILFDSLDTREEYKKTSKKDEQHWMEEEKEVAQLTVDTYQTQDEIIIQTIVAGVAPENLDISITREMVTIRGERYKEDETSEDDYFHKELYWGAFSRTIMLPEEIDVEEATAKEKHGLLTITLPKIDKKKTTKLKVETG